MMCDYACFGMAWTQYHLHTCSSKSEAINESLVSSFIQPEQTFQGIINYVGDWSMAAGANRLTFLYPHLCFHCKSMKRTLPCSCVSRMFHILCISFSLDISQTNLEVSILFTVPSKIWSTINSSITFVLMLMLMLAVQLQIMMKSLWCKFVCSDAPITQSFVGLSKPAFMLPLQI